MDNNMYVNIEELVINENFYKYSDIITYPIAGAFVEYLISIFGIDKFKQLYVSLDEEIIKIEDGVLIDRALLVSINLNNEKVILGVK